MKNENKKDKELSLKTELLKIKVQKAKEHHAKRRKSFLERKANV